MTSMLVNAAFAPQPAIPASIVYKERPILQQVDAKKLAKKLLTKLASKNSVLVFDPCLRDAYVVLLMGGTEFKRVVSAYVGLSQIALTYSAHLAVIFGFWLAFYYKP